MIAHYRDELMTTETDEERPYQQGLDTPESQSASEGSTSHEGDLLGYLNEIAEMENEPLTSGSESISGSESPKADDIKIPGLTSTSISETDSEEMRRANELAGHALDTREHSEMETEELTMTYKEALFSREDKFHAV